MTFSSPAYTDRRLGSVGPSPVMPYRALERGLPRNVVRPQRKPKPANPAKRDWLFVASERVDSISIRDIQDVVCRRFGMTRRELLTQRMTKRYIHARWASYWLSRELTLLSTPAIGRSHADRDHATIIHGAASLDRLMASDHELRDRILAMKAELEVRENV